MALKIWLTLEKTWRQLRWRLRKLDRVKMDMEIGKELELHERNRSDTTFETEMIWEWK